MAAGKLPGHPGILQEIFFKNVVLQHLFAFTRKLINDELRVCFHYTFLPIVKS
jgi:hypothetical protein